MSELFAIADLSSPSAKRPDMRVADVVATDLPEEFRVVIRNIGGVDAVVETLRLSCDLWAKSLSANSANEVRTRVDHPVVVVGIGEDYAAPPSSMYRMQNRVDASVGKLAVYLFGVITYSALTEDDVETELNRTWFCWKWDGEKFVDEGLTDPAFNGRT